MITKNSRKDGTLIVKLKKGYIMGVDGHPKRVYKVKCLEIDYESEYTAADLEQYLSISIMSQVTTGKEEIQSVESKEQEKKVKDFYNNESPSVAEVEEQALIFETMVKFNNAIQMSKIMKTFEEFVYQKRICLEDDSSMSINIWKTLDRDDKNKIIFSYIAFFVNPLQKLSELSIQTEVEKKVMQGEKEKI